MVVVQMDHKRSLFRSSRVKSYVSQQSTEHVALRKISTDDDDAIYLDEDPEVISNKRYVRNSSTKEESSFAKDCEEQISGLIQNGTFHVVNISSIYKNIRILGSKFVDTIKLVDDGYRCRCRVVA